MFRYNEIRKKSALQWLSEMEAHEDVAVHGGVKVTREYIEHLETEINRLKSEKQLKNQYLKKVVIK